uniref:Serpentine receptor class gamma n=1 Tax=Globodera rostochiensis TaxID=31243 RepID=A0A914HKN5_GLORO
MGFTEWFISVRIPINYLTICLTIPSMALYIAEIVTIVRHKKFHNSFYALFVMRAIPDCLYVLSSFYSYRVPSIIGAVIYSIYSQFSNWMLAISFFVTGHTHQTNNFVTAFILLNRLTAIIMPIKHEKIWQKFLPFITIFVYFVPTLLCWPVFKTDATIQLLNPNSTTDRTFVINEAGDATYTNYLTYISAAFSIIFTILCVLINIGIFVAYKLHMNKVGVNCGNNEALIERKLIFIGCNSDAKTKAILYIYYPLIMDIGTVVLSSWLLLWASGTFRQQLIKDFAIIRITNIQNVRVHAIAGPRNNNHRPVGGAVGHQLQNRIYSSVQQLPAIS